MGKEAEAIAIIGGSDGPTAIFIAGSLGIGFYAAAAVIILVIITGLYLICRKRKK